MLDEPIHLVAHRPEWSALFAREHQRLRAALSVSPERIVHIGSTAVPALLAKPIVDILVGVDKFPPEASVEASLVGLGYEAMGEAGLPGRWYFRIRDESPRNVHVVEHGGQHWRQNLAFRDYLRSDVRARERYAEAKLMAVESGATSLIAYTRAKGDTVRALIAEAVAR